MIFAAFFIVGALVGGVIVYFVRGRVQNEFKAAASDTLQKTAEQFLLTAIKDLRQVKTEADDSITRQKDHILTSVDEMKAKLDESQKLVRAFEEERGQVYGKLEKSLSQVLEAEQLIRLETSSLKSALSASSGVRGRWGERILLEILEQNGLVRGINFDTQVVLSNESQNDSRPDFVINLPDGKHLVIDSKDITGEYLAAQETNDPTRQKEHFEKLVANIRLNITKLGRKEYQSLLDSDIPFVVMFIPSEAAIRAAFATDPGIFEDATAKRVILASPMTVIPLIYLIKNAWRQHQLAEHARELGDVVEDLGDRIYKFVKHLQGIQGGLEKATDNWNSAVGSWTRSVRPQIDKVQALGGQLKDPEELSTIDVQPRLLSEPRA